MQKEDTSRIGKSTLISHVDQILLPKVQVEGRAGDGGTGDDLPPGFTQGGDETGREVNTPRRAFVRVLTRADVGNGIVGELDGRHASPLETHALRSKMKVQVMKSVFLIVIRKIFHIHWSQMQDEHSISVRGIASFSHIDEKTIDNMDVEK